MSKIHTRLYDMKTWLRMSYPLGLYIKAAALCPDGKVRKTKWISSTADTFFSIPCSIKFRGKSVSGYISVDEIESSKVVKFIPYKNRKNSNIFEESPQLSLKL